MEPHQTFKGIWPVLVTPYDDDLNIDLDAYREMIRWYLRFELGGIYANCQSSEMYELSDEERLLLIEEAVRIVDGKFPVAATGNFGNSLKSHIEFCKKVADCGADVVMLTVPDFAENDSDLEAYYLAVAEQASFPLGLYECPFPRSYHLGIPLIDTLAQSGRFVAFKETSCEMAKIRQVIGAVKGTPLALLQANLPFLLEAMRAGAQGSMNIVTNWLPDLTTEVVHRAMTGDPQADYMHQQLCAMEMAQRSVHPTGVKYLMSKRGIPIKPHTRYKRKLSSEEAYSLDAAADIWFTADGSVRLLAEMPQVNSMG